MDKIILGVMAVFSVAGALDRIFGSRLGLGKAFEEGILTIGQLSLSMIGIIVLCPVLASFLEPVVTPLYRFLGADGAMFAGSFFACDMGGAPLAAQLTQDPAAARLSGIVTASMLGATVSFTIPASMTALDKADHPHAAKGILCGVVTIPVGVLVGGLAAGYPLVMVLKNTLPVLLVAVLIALGLWKAEKLLIKGFVAFGKFLVAVAVLGLALAGVELTTGFVLIPGLGDMKDAFAVVGQIAVVLSGALPMMMCITKLLKKPIGFLSRKIGINDTALSGLVATLANSIATFAMVKNMDNRGKVVNMAFAVSGAFVLGDHLAYTAGYDSTMIPAMMAGKLSAGILAVCLALLITKEKKHV